MGDIEYRDFDGDLEALAQVARDSWLEAYGLSVWPDLYKPELARHFFSTVDDPRYLVGAYHGPKLVAFVANLPRTYRFRAKRYKAVLSCMLVGHRAYRRRGIVRALIAECLRRNEEIGCDLALMTIERKHRSALMFDKHLKPKHRIEVLKVIHPIVRPIDFDLIRQNERMKWWQVAAAKLFGAHRELCAPPVPGTVRPYRPADLPEILQLVGRYSDQNGLVRLFDAPTLAKQLGTPGITDTVVYEKNGSVAGFVNCTFYDLVGPRGGARWSWLDLLYWEGLRRAEKQALLAGLYRSSKEHDSIGILEWSKGYYRTGSLYRARFVPYPRYLELDAWIFNPELRLDRLDSIFEQQI